MTTPLTNVSIINPASLGLNTEDPALAEDQRVALQLDNAAYDSQGRVCARKGWTEVGSFVGEGGGDPFEVVFEYVESSTSSRIIEAGGLELFEGTSSINNVNGGVAPAADYWQFLNFNGKCIGVQAGETAIVKDGAGDFEDITASSGTVPSGNAGLSAWGRLWVSDNNERTLKFSGLLDETDWGGAGAGSIDTSEVWPDGLDRIVALAEWQDRLIIFGTRSILIYSNPEDPTDTAFTLTETVRVGCVARDSVAAVADDLIFLSIDGLHSLRRAIEFSNLPQQSLALGVRTELAEDIAQVISTPQTIKATYSRLDGLYMVRVGTTYWAFDMRTGQARGTRWFGIGWLGAHAATNGTVYFGHPGGILGQYGGYTDGGEPYQFRYRSAFLDLAQGREVYPKTAVVTLISTGDYTVTFSTTYDYVGDSEDSQYTMMSARTVSEWQPANVATTSVNEWGTAEWSGGTTSVVRAPFDLAGAGSRVQLGISVNIDGKLFCIQRIDVNARVGRIAA